MLPALLTRFLMFAFFCRLFQFEASLKAGPSHVQNVTLWLVEKESTLQVKGKSNINAFACAIGDYNRKDTLVLTAKPKAGALGLNGELVLDIESFDCHNRLITGDLRKTLKAKQHPLLRVRFLSLDKAPDTNHPKQIIYGWVEVELAGVKKLMLIPFRFTKNGSERLLMNGSKQFYFSDFGLVPPTKMAGTVKIKDEFEVEFKLELKEVH